MEDRNAVRTVLKEHDITHEEVAKLLDVSRPTITLWLAGEVSSPKLDVGITAFAAGLERSRK